MHPNATTSGAGHVTSGTDHVIVNEMAVESVGAVEQSLAVREDEFWDYDKQIDLEGGLLFT